MMASDQNGATMLDAERLLHARMAEACALLLRHAPGLTPEARQVLYDVQRGTRSRFRTLATMLALSARCEDPSVRYLVPELVRGAVVGAGPAPVLGTVEAFDLETEHQGRGDRAQLAHAAQRAPHTAEAAISALAGHLEAIRAALDALHGERARFAATPRGIAAAAPAWHARRQHEPALVGAARR